MKKISLTVYMGGIDYKGEPTESELYMTVNISDASYEKLALIFSKEDFDSFEFEISDEAPEVEQEIDSAIYDAALEEGYIQEGDDQDGTYLEADCSTIELL